MGKKKFENKIKSLDILQIEQKYFEKTWWGLFRNYILYIDYYSEVK